MKYLRGAHLLVGVLGFMAFVVTGQYMELAFSHLRGMPDGTRLMFRSSHIYALYGALLNMALGAYFRPLAARAAMRLQMIGSVVILVVPVLLLVSFFAESQNYPLRRPIAVAGIYLSLVGVALHLFAALADRKVPVKENP